jgi:hypothetical protein
VTAVAGKLRRQVLKGSAKPRVAPPTPARSDLAGFRDTAAELGIALMPWQLTAGRYLEAQARDERHLYREVGVVVARQNGKTTLLVPLIVKRMLKGRRIMHTAQDRSLPREVFYQVAEALYAHHADLFPRRNDRPTKPRYANGQEEIRLTNGGIYRIVAPTRGGARGPSNDDVIVDELREMDAWDFIAAAKPTMTASKDPQIIYLSNAGEDDSVVLNALRDRAEEDPNLAYLEWSAAPGRRADDRAGWAEANPAIGHEPEGMGSVLETLQTEHRTAVLEGTLSIFEVEHLCRWQQTTRETLVADDDWASAEAALEDPPRRACIGVSMDPGGRRASAAIAWPRADETFGLRLLYDVTGSPIDADRLGRDLRDMARQLGVAVAGFDPLTDAVLAKYFPRSEAVSGQKYANATARFVTALESKKLKWTDSAAVGEDLTWTAKKPHDETGSFQAVRAQDDRPITAALAAIRAVYLASAPRPAPVTPRASAAGF